MIICIYIWFETGGMDACDKAAKLFQCGKENSPDAMADLISSFEISMNVRLSYLEAFSFFAPSNIKAHAISMKKQCARRNVHFLQILNFCLKTKICLNERKKSWDTKLKDERFEHTSIKKNEIWSICWTSKYFEASRQN